MGVYNEAKWVAFFQALAQHPKRDRFLAEDVVEIAYQHGIITRQGKYAPRSLSMALRPILNTQTAWGLLEGHDEVLTEGRFRVYSFTPSPNLARSAAMSEYTVDPVTSDELTAAFEPEQSAQSADETALIPFHGSALRVAKDGEQVYVAIRPICEHLGLHLQTQIEKLRSDDDFNCTVIRMVAEDGKEREQICLPQEQLLGWLYTINSNRVSPMSRQILKKYRQETTQAINDYWTKGYAVRNGQAAITASTSSIDFGAFDRILGVEQALQKVIDTVPRVIDVKVDEVKQEIRSEVDALRDEFERTKPISEAQAKIIHGKVTALGPYVGGYGAAWKMFKDRMQVAKYDRMPAIQFDEAIEFLDGLAKAYKRPNLFDESAD